MSNPKSAKQTASGDARDWPSARIAYELRLRGLTYRKLSLANGYCGGALEQTARRHLPRWEAIIAEALGMRPEQIWPSRYPRRQRRRRRAS
ncbi:helix-turn-helix domain-containing protein [bacterium]|nr:helix-turn-helix domain-containing protein [bacterium]